MTRPVMLDTFCGAGGATKGYQRAGFYVIGVDIEPQPNYCGDEFHQADAMRVLEFIAAGAEPWPGAPGFNVIHASPPCQAYAEAATTRKRDDHPDLLLPVRDLLEQIGLPYVVENIATAPMPGSILLCGSTFGLPVVRHRRFWISPDPGLVPSMCHQTRHARAVSHGSGFYPYAHGSWEAAWREHVLPVVWPWMTLDEAGQAIPPAYTELIGRQLLEALAVPASP